MRTTIHHLICITYMVTRQLLQVATPMCISMKLWITPMRTTPMHITAMGIKGKRHPSGGDNKRFMSESVCLIPAVWQRWLVFF